ncbi:lipid droplet phospholipase 1-like [Aristolochia californica]|uniref:lipid droplet phospholipase 1-like n=1 Tax=Aristolochia californica TaxID=171875 RepID=UPI0035E07A80
MNLNSREDHGVRTESVDGGQDVWSSESSSAYTDHLVVMVHGILGNTTDWSFAADKFVRTFPDKVIVHSSESNILKLTLDGVDVMGERLAEEVVEVIKRKPQLRKISFVAHSVGGLVARYAIGRLYRLAGRHESGDASNVAASDGICEKDSKGTISGLEPMNFITVATPHLGSRGNKQVPFLFGVTVFERAASRVIHWIFRKTGKHLFLTDSRKGEPPLLKRMVDDSDDLRFISALRAFKRRVVYSNVSHDHIVGWRTSSIRRDCELPKWDDPVSDKYPHIVYEERTKEDETEQQALVLTGQDGSDILEEELIIGLSRVSWIKVDVSFANSRQKFLAHSVIQAKDTSMQSEGADVIQHMIDHFLT